MTIVKKSASIFELWAVTTLYLMVPQVYSNWMIGQKIMISGMLIEIVSDAGDKWEARNITTQETVYFDKSFLEKAIKLGKAERVSDLENNNS